MGSSPETADTNPGTGCRISRIVTQMNYPVLALCCNTRTELSHSGRDVGPGQVFPHPCAVDCCLAQSTGSLRGACRGVAVAAAEPACLACLSFQASSQWRTRFPAAGVLCSPRGGRQRACLSQSCFQGVWGNVSIALRNIFSHFYLPSCS